MIEFEKDEKEPGGLTMILVWIVMLYSCYAVWGYIYHMVRSPSSVESQMSEQRGITGDESAIVVERPTPTPSVLKVSGYLPEGASQN